MVKAARALNVAALMILGVLATARPGLAGEVVVPVELRDYAGLQPNVLTRAEADVTAIFSRAGIDIVWIDPSQQNASLGGGGLVIVNILSRAPAQQIHVNANALGFTPVTRAAGHITFVIGSRIDEMAQRYGMDKAVLLGATIAHEMGHLLLPHVPHSAGGIMRASWGRADVQLAAQRSLLFLPLEAQILRAAAEAR
jgi:hypothetical protein